MTATAFEIELRTHVAPKSNMRGHWRNRHRVDAPERGQACSMVESRMRGVQAKEPNSGEAYWQEFKRWSVSKKTGARKAIYRRVLSRHWQERLDRGLVVTFTRFADRTLDNDDNLRDAFKSVKDGICDAFGIDDSNREKRITWVYASQVKAWPSRITLRVEWTEGDSR